MLNGQNRKVKTVWGEHKTLGGHLKDLKCHKVTHIHHICILKVFGPDVISFKLYVNQSKCEIKSKYFECDICECVPLGVHWRASMWECVCLPDLVGTLWGRTIVYLCVPVSRWEGNKCQRVPTLLLHTVLLLTMACVRDGVAIL